MDEAESGRIADRPQFRRVLDEPSRSDPLFQEILVWEFSRFTRKREHAVAFKSMLRRRGVRVVSITEQADDTPTGRLWFRNGVHIILRNEAYPGTLVWGTTAKDKAETVRVEKAFPAIISKAQFRRVNRKLRSRAPKGSHCHRVGSSYLLRGLVRCKTCNSALSGQDSKSGQFSYYVCQSVMKQGSGACEAPRLNASRFEELVVGKIRENVLTESNIRELVRMVDEEMDGVAQERREAFEQEARAMLSQRREVLDEVETITAYA